MNEVKTAASALSERQGEQPKPPGADSVNGAKTPQVIINSYEDLEQLVGKHIGVSDYMLVSQEIINTFADATMDHQWIHTDPERAAVESPFHHTIAHGFLTLSLLTHHWNQLVQVNNLRQTVNYGIDKVKFGHPVLAGQRVRVSAYLHSLANLRGVAKTQIKFCMEIEGERKKALEGIATFLYYFNK